MKKQFILATNYTLLAFRSLTRHKKHMLINIIGLAAGFVAFVLIYLFLTHEYSYDKSWNAYKNIYRVNESFTFGQEDHFALSSYNVSQTMKHDFPEIEAATIIHRSSRSQENNGLTCWYEDRMYRIPAFTMADEDFFSVFDYPFLEGNPKNALMAPYSIVIDSETKYSIFGNEQALGKTIRLDDKLYQITGVIDKNARLSHLTFDVLVSQSSLPAKQFDEWRADWCWLIGYTYVKFKDASLAADFDMKLETLAENTLRPWLQSENVSGDIKLYIEPITDVHFNTLLQYDSDTNTNRRFVNMFVYIAAFLILIASINYMNLSTARSMKRAREIGIRKVVGAYRSQLIAQFLGESILITLFSFGLALLLTWLLLPWFNDLIGMKLSLRQLFDFKQNIFGVYLLLIVLFVGFLSGSFPAFVLSSFKPINALRKSFSVQHNNLFSAVNLRKILVVLQFVISIGMIISTLIVSSQLRFMHNFDYGINLEKNMIVYFPSDTTLRNNSAAIREKLLGLPEVDKVTLPGGLPGYSTGRLMFYMIDSADAEIKTMNVHSVDHEFFDFFGIQLADGRLFSKEITSDEKLAFVINQAAANFIGAANPIGFRMACMGVEGPIIGVVKNYYYSSLHSPIEPIVFILQTNRPTFMGIHIQTDNLSEAIDRIATIWHDFDRNHFMNYTFLDERFATKYENEEKMFALFGWFSLLVVLISCLGLYGLSSFTVEQRSKEIGIRKILGSSTFEIIRLFVVDFMRLVVIAGCISIPITYFLMSEWLSDFANRVTLHVGWFVLGFLIALLISLLTVLSQALKAVHKNPVDVIKYE